jgi:hypothetical protein
MPHVTITHRHTHMSYMCAMPGTPVARSCVVSSASHLRPAPLPLSLIPSKVLVALGGLCFLS